MKGKLSLASSSRILTAKLDKTLRGASAAVHGANTLSRLTHAIANLLRAGDTDTTPNLDPRFPSAASEYPFTVRLVTLPW